MPVLGPGEAQTPRGAAFWVPAGRPDEITTLHFASPGLSRSYFVAGSGPPSPVAGGREPFPDQLWAWGVCLHRLRGCSGVSCD